MFYAKLALTNLKKNHRGYLPFLISMLFLVAINTMTQVIVNNEGMRALPGGGSASAMFGLGHIVIIIFTIIFSLNTVLMWLSFCLQSIFFWKTER